MAPVTPTTAEISANIVAQLEGQLEQTIPILPKAFLRVLAKVLGAVFILLYKYIGFVFLQMFVAHASMRPTVINGKTVVPLVEWGRLIGIGDPVEATHAELILDVEVLNQTGSLPANAQLVFPATGVVYLTTGAVALDAPTVQVTARASSDQTGGGGAGSIGNLEPGDIVSFASPLPNVSRNAAVASQAVTGAAAETPEAYRARVVRRFQRKPQGGAYADYQVWGESVAGILTVYPYTGDPGEVDVYVEATVDSSGSPDGIPTGAQLNAVAAAINFDVNGLASNRPANAAINVDGISRTSFDVDIVGLVADDVPAAKVALEAALDEYFRGREPYIEGLSTLPRKDRITQSAAGGVADASVSARGGLLTSLTMTLNGVDQPTYTLGDGEKSKLGVVTYDGV